MKIYTIEEALKELGKDINSLSEKMTIEAKQQVQVLAAAAHGMVIQKAQTRLKSLKNKYIEAVNIQKIASDGTNEIWAVTLDKSAEWIETGLPKRNMIDVFLKSPKAKIAKNGNKYMIIPFEHSKGADKSAAQNKLADYVQGELKKRGLDKVIQKDGKPMLGKVAKLNLADEGAPVSKQGKPLLAGLTIYQREVTSKAGNKSVKRDVMTFRVVSSSQKGKGLWDYPELKGAKIFEEVERELDSVWDKMVQSIAEGIK